MNDGRDMSWVTPIGDDPEHDEVARRLRTALEREAAMVRPSEAGYDHIRQRIQGEHPGRTRRIGRRALVAAAAVVVISGGVGAGILRPGEDNDVATAPSPSATVSSTPSPASSQSPAPTASGAESGYLSGVPVYWLGDTKASTFLYREFRTVEDRGNAVQSAVEFAMSGDPEDPDHYTPWTTPSRVTAELGERDAGLTIDVSEDAFGNTTIGSRKAELAVQQLVWTASAAAADAGLGENLPVRITVDGQAYDAWGAVRVGEDWMNRADPQGTQAPIMIEEPREGSEVDAPTLTVSGTSSTFEATVQWEIVDREGNPIAQDFTTGGSTEFAPFEFSVDLAPGTYTVRVWEDDASDGESAEGPRMFEQDRTFSVR